MTGSNGSVWHSAALGAGFFVLYAAGACPTIYVGDSGELVAAVHTLGIPHPSGYPLYVLLGKLWTLAVPVGSVAYRMSLFSAACAALTVGFVHSVCRRLGLHPVAALTSAMLLGRERELLGTGQHAARVQLERAVPDPRGFGRVVLAPLAAEPDSFCCVLLVRARG